MKEITFIQERKINKTTRDFVRENLKKLNDSLSPFHKLTRDTENIIQITISAFSKKDVLIGGLLARVYWNWLEIEDVFVEEKFRNLKIGRNLVEQAEKFAINNFAAKAFVKTYSFQAKPFYEKCGYKITGELKDYPPGFSFYWLTKELK